MNHHRRISLPRTLSVLVLSTSVIPLTPSDSRAADRTWVNVAGGSWATASNWSGAVVPGTADNAYVAFAPASDASIILNANYSGTQGLGTVDLDSSNDHSLTLLHTLAGNYLVAISEIVGDAGHATYAQSAAGNLPSSSLTLGNAANSAGTYSLSGSGFLSTSTEYLGYDGTGSFIQSGGSNSTSSFYLAYTTGSTGFYSLSAGSLDANYAYVGYGGVAATFNQSGGQSNADLILGVNIVGTYNLSGGTLHSSTQYIGYGSAGNGLFSQTGGTNSPGQAYVGYGGIGSYSLSGPSASFSAVDLTIGYGANGSFTQSAGTAAISSIWAGMLPGSTGSYTLTGGSLSIGEANFGFFSSGSFVQTGGSLSTSQFYLGYATPSATGLYSLSGSGTLSVNIEYVGYSGSGTITQTDGTHHATALYLGFAPGAAGSYALADGTLSVAIDSYVGRGGFATFAQSGGTFSTRSLHLAVDAGSSARYSLSAGSLSATNITVGEQGTATFAQSGGSLNASSLTLSHGYLAQSGGTLTTPSFSISPTGIYDLGAGTLAASNVSNSGVFFMSPAASFTLTPGGTFANSGSATFDGTQNWSGTLVNTNMALFRSAIDAVVIADSPTGYSSVTFEGYSTTLRSLTLLNQSRAYVTPGGDRSITILTPNIAPAAQLDIADATLNLVFTNIDTARDYLLHRQILSSLAGPATGRSLAYGYPFTGPGPGAWLGVLLTYTGDANLDGSLDPDDYATLDRCFALHLTDAHWADGDFNYDGIIDSSDYLLIDSTYLSLHPSTAPSLLATRESQFGPTYVTALLASIPEPTALFPILYPLSSLLLPRRRILRPCESSLPSWPS